MSVSLLPEQTKQKREFRTETRIYSQSVKRLKHFRYYVNKEKQVPQKQVIHLNQKVFFKRRLTCLF